MTERAAVRAAALDWHDAGYCVLPASGDGSKSPGVGSWKLYQREQYPRTKLEAATDAGIGLLCGSVSGGLEMLELEGRAVDEGVLADLVSLVDASGLGGLWARLTAGPQAYVERTPSGGLHILYRLADVPVPGNAKLASRPTTAVELAASPRERVKVLAETRGEGGYVIVAPSFGSTHPTGKPWEVTTGRAGVVPTITGDEREQLHRLVRALDRMPEPEPRNELRAPRQRTSGDVSPGDDFAQRTDWADILEPYDWTEVHRPGGGDIRYWARPGKGVGISATTNARGTDRFHNFSTSAWPFESEQSYSKFGAYAVLNHGGDFAAAARELAGRGYGTPSAGAQDRSHQMNAAQPADAWDDPLPLGWHADLPPFPVDALPGTLARFVRGLSLEVQTPADLPGSVVLGILAACVGGRVVVVVRRGWHEPTNLFVVPVMPPGSRKSAVISVCRRPLTEAEAALAETVGTLVRDRRTEREIREQYAEAAKRVAAKDGDPIKIMEAQEAVRAAEQVVVPAWPRLTASDATPEALITLLANQGGRIAAISAEAGIFTALTGRYSKAPNLDPILMAHAGDAILVDRRGREPERVDAPALTLVASIQPYALREMVERPDFGGRGVLARILWALPVDNTGHRDVEPPEMPERDRDAYQALIYDLALDMAGRDAPVPVVLSEAARKVHLEYHRAVEARLRRGGELGADLVREWGSKLAGAVARIAGCLHAAGDSLTEPISETTMRSAVALGDYYQAHAVAALAPGDDPSTGPARVLLAYLIDKGLTRFKLRDLQRSGPKTLRKAADARPVLDSLTELGWIREHQDGGWEVHPRAAQLLKAGDTGDTGDNPGVSAGQDMSQPVAHTVAPAGDKGDTFTQPSRSVASVAQAGDSPGDRATPALSRENTESVALVAPVAPLWPDDDEPTCPECGWGYGTSAHQTNCEATR